MNADDELACDMRDAMREIETALSSIAEAMSRTDEHSAAGNLLRRSAAKVAQISGRIGMRLEKRELLER